uniref:Histone acetyltransferase n=1 Tax=Chromera velia CCMP2878 TaxID=1169474 RepID=A0A0G4I3I3_9ALVE|mmetsp:Transcript_49667/g.97874  ORF Transcript_49667/g.97874 Transcript_49667/m.97874 type:complete len:484 (+) Transcript_49667:264-1715(+)|eukprot:Cvel_1754.t1-p1 / transcript=Cvel_1754.t1 / gene=Cvel_1754 / organism=Chromera_velia_CCMP2878 / gene_product=Putative MYST-like histone acetyltransferase 1, putative / transcript_product=Putative MYST-like histone acetyltransferase 1, putative / location=Cvel_scaffold64:51017-56724(+) / protein_length=483 / sequence_SO=supercontig / SO=protein_coding / is_pseudo=false
MRQDGKSHSSSKAAATKGEGAPSKSGAQKRDHAQMTKEKEAATLSAAWPVNTYVLVHLPTPTGHGGCPKDSLRRAKIMHARVRADLPEDQAKSPSDFDYYLHISKVNRRLDDWFKFDKMLPYDANKDPLHPKHPIPQPSKKPKPNPKQDGKGGGESGDDTDESGHEGMDRASLAQHKQVTKLKTVQRILIGKHELTTWYFSPFPKEFCNRDMIYFCEFCLSFFRFPVELEHHMKRCRMRHPPGDEVYRDTITVGGGGGRGGTERTLSMWEVDGFLARTWCENLCFLAKLFLDHKTLAFDTAPFLFYVLCELDDTGSHIVGYFSKEKESKEGYNLACILTLPHHQRKGYGKFLIEFSYLLSRKEEKPGSPEKPLSDLGRTSYNSWWTWRLLTLLRSLGSRDSVTLEELSAQTGMIIGDIENTLKAIDCLKYTGGRYILALPPKLVDFHLRQVGRPTIPVDPNKLHWSPFRYAEVLGNAGAAGVI